MKLARVPRRAALARGLVCGLLIGASLGGCAGLRGVAGKDGWLDDEPIYYGYYRPDRKGYATFREAYDEIYEPNYLPFMLHRIPGDETRGDDLVLCRWPAEKMPISVSIELPEISESIQDEFNPVPPADYLDAVVAALDTWEEALEGLVRFRRIEPGQGRRAADLRLRLIGKKAPSPTPDVQVLGSTEGLESACEAHGWDRDADRLRVEFHVGELALYVADEFGLLMPEQVRRIALHEIGHALGMPGHSPLSTDLMYPILGEDRRVDALSIQDLNSFLSLYRLPNGAHYGRTTPEELAPAGPAEPPSGTPELSLSPFVDSRIGFSIRTPARWLRVETPNGFFTANGPFWDYDASLEIFVWPYPTIESYLQRFGPMFFADGWVRHFGWMVVNGRRALQISFEQTDERSADFIVIELGDGRVMMLLSQCPREYREDWRPWFRASLSSLQLWD